MTEVTMTPEDEKFAKAAVERRLIELRIGGVELAIMLAQDSVANGVILEEDYKRVTGSRLAFDRATGELVVQLLSENEPFTSDLPTI